jgi:hypothetical protein
MTGSVELRLPTITCERDGKRSPHGLSRASAMKVVSHGNHRIPFKKNRRSLKVRMVTVGNLAVGKCVKSIEFGSKQAH